MLIDPKQQTRLDNLALITHPTHGARLLFDSTPTIEHPNGRLRYPWVELAGPEAPTATLLQDQRLLTAEAPFIGVDINPQVLRDAAKRFSQETTRWVPGEMGPLVRSRSTLIGDAGVLVYDSWDGAVGRAFFQILPDLAAFARERARAIGEFLLVLNVSVRGVENVQRNKAYRRELDAAFPECLFTDDSFHVYSSTGKSQMCLTRIRFGF